MKITKKAVFIGLGALAVVGLSIGLYIHHKNKDEKSSSDKLATDTTPTTPSVTTPATPQKITLPNGVLGKNLGATLAKVQNVADKVSSAAIRLRPQPQN